MGNRFSLRRTFVKCDGSDRSKWRKASTHDLSDLDTNYSHEATTASNSSPMINVHPCQGQGGGGVG
jgi:hypothetical protein